MSFNFVIPEMNIGGAGTPPLQFYRRGFNIGGTAQPSWRDVIISGNTALTLVNAKANGLNYLKLFGKCEQNGTPTPSNPVDIVCNNGIIKVKDDELPVGYRRLTGISYDSNFYYNTRQKLYGTDTLTVRLSGTSSNGRNVIGAYSGTGDGARNFSLFIYGANSTSNSYLRHGTELARPRYGSETRTLVMSPTGTDGFLADVTYNQETFETTSDFWIGGLPNSSLTKYDGNIEGNITVSTRLKYIPVEREIDGEIGYYETFNSEFLEKQGTGTSVSMGYDTSHLTEIYYDGTVETVEIDTTGNTATAQPLLAVGNYKDVQEIKTGTVTRNVGIKVLDGTEDWVVASVSSVRYILLEDTTDSNRYDIISSHFKSDPVSFANMSNNSGCLTRITTVSKKAIALKAESYATLNDWKQFLADQCENGTPVTVIYPLATATTESVTAQPLTIQAGTNVVEITQASLNNLELEVSYKAGVEVTIEEIEAVNNDESVEVTING